jgi:hypothetical protein
MSPRKRSKKAFTERAIVESVTRFLQRQRYRVRHEVPNMGQSADIVATRSRAVIFVEAKVAHWRRALEQCRAHESVADYICLAVGLASIPDGLLLAVCKNGYGLIACGPSDRKCRWVRKPVRNRSVWSPQRRRLTSLMGVIDYVD